MSKSYASAAGSGVGMTAQVAARDEQQWSNNISSTRSSNSAQATTARGSQSPRHTPRTESPEGTVYVLTLQTDDHLHQRMTTPRKKYFPTQINKLEAHLTLFHALPESKLESSIIPTIQHIAGTTQSFTVKATKHFRLNKGVAIGISKPQGGEQGQEVHHALQAAWKDQGFLSDQDAGGCRLHYTIMNKVDDPTTIDSALAEVQEAFKGDRGSAIGLGLWKYDRGFWRWERMFAFQDQH